MRSIIGYIKRLIPTSFKHTLRSYRFIRKYGFRPPPPFSDMSGYELLLDTIIQQESFRLDGDFVEIGAFLGGGTYKISKLLEKLRVDKKIFVIDIFNPEFDKTACIRGEIMSKLYKRVLKEKNQYEVYKEITKNCRNVVTLIGDSKGMSLPCKKIAFAYIDGNHSPEYVKSDFYLVWDKLVSKGVITFDDYGYDLPQVTRTIHQLIAEKSNEILKIWTANLKTIFIQKQ